MGDNLSYCSGPYPGEPHAVLGVAPMNGTLGIGVKFVRPRHLYPFRLPPE